MVLTAKYVRNDAIFEVEDNGSGIESEDLPHIFERFYRSDKARSRAKTGTGLGLAVVRSIVDLHGGSVHVTSNPGQGSCFAMRIPVKGRGCPWGTASVAFSKRLRAG